MTAIHHLTLETPDAPTAEAFLRATFGPDLPVRARTTDAPSTGFRGFVIGVDLPSPTAVDAVVTRALAAGATTVKAAEPQPWGGYSGVLRAPDGTLWKVATAASEGGGSTAPTIDRVVLLLGVADLAASAQGYADRGFVIAKSYGPYVELDPEGGAVTVGLYERAGLAAELGVSAEGSGSPRLAIGGEGEAFVDLDGFAWEPVAALRS